MTESQSRCCPQCHKLWHDCFCPHQYIPTTADSLTVASATPNPMSQNTEKPVMQYGDVGVCAFCHKPITVLLTPPADYNIYQGVKRSDMIPIWVHEETLAVNCVLKATPKND